MPPIHANTLKAVADKSASCVLFRLISHDTARSQDNFLYSEDDFLLGCCAVYSGSEVLTACYTAHRPDDGGSKHLGNVGQFLPDCTAQHARRQSSSCALTCDVRATLAPLNIDP
jgi:hypothetical protein